MINVNESLIREIASNLRNKSRMDAVSPAQLHGPFKAHSRMLKIVQVIIIERVGKSL